MNNNQKVLKSTLSAKCRECGDPCREGNKYCGKIACRVQAHFRRKIEAPIKAEAAGEAQKSMAREVKTQIEYMKISLIYLEDLIKEILK